MPLLTSVDQLVTELEAGAPIRLLDVRWRLDQSEGRPDYLAGHLPGAVYVDLERELAQPGHPEAGRYPLPELAELTASARRWGINHGDRVVVYDDNYGVAAARAWWLLRRHGVDASVLDGGFRAWIDAGLPLERSDQAVRAGDVVLREAVDGTATIDEAATAPRIGVLVDVRAPRHYRGNASALDPVAGHIPGAVNLPTVSHVGPTGLFRAPDEIRLTLAAYGIRPGVPVVVYCGAGIASAHSVLAYALAGVDARIYAGSWSQWSRTKGRPIAVGAAPSSVIAAV